LPGTDVALAKAIENDLVQLAIRLPEGEPSPEPDQSVHAVTRHAWSQAVLTLRALARGVPLADELGPGTSSHAGAEVPVNAVLPTASTEDTVKAAEEAVRQGYTCLKMKVGPAHKEVLRVAAVRLAVGPIVRLRVDANGTWSESLAPQILKGLAPLDIEYVEDPLPPALVRELQRLRRSSPVPLAADETAHHPAQALALVEKNAVDVLVIKPMVLGGPDRAASLVQTAEQAGVRVVVTDSAESSVGRFGALHVAALLRHPRPHCGLGSGQWLERDVLPHPVLPHRGKLHIPDRPGLGLDVPPPPSEAP
jgi:L-Ala-D/L-Glu epimerase